MEESQHPPVVVDSMTIVAPSPHHLPLECSVKWTATQERSINHEFPFIDLHLETPEDYVSRIYLQHLWLPESLMPLRFLVLSLLRVTSDPQPSAQTPAPHCLIHLLHPLLLTPRACSQKYQTHVSQVLADDSSGSSDVEESMMWYALKFEKMDDDQGRHAKGDHHVLDGKWKNDWLERMERREVLIQILLHFLLLSLPGVPTPNQTDSPPASPRKRKRHQRDDVLPSTAVLEEQLEFLMDKLSMWQLMSSLDEPGRPGAPLPNSKGKQKAVDERDWMQVFCEDLVERL
ncbi:hypothetical protein CERSUDRAFT_73049 [Gelatoporia subvermispora B]|uniref:DNA replication regulator Sld3 C-terminal domain-containing protein n=1 Tax=Ceriporiopsis subvermispora (strain B) TaxID=914234 RepID=M2PPX6_CERS8|nr:hypothetical protein CERSUDRAFT_73049 [Gelatoporia subvermispora B]